MTERSAVRALLWLIAGSAAIRLVLAASIGLGVDESYMLAAGRQLQWGYFDHPPVAWWLSGGIAQLVGSEAAPVVRLPFIALFALSTWLLYRLTARLFTPRAGLCAAVAFNLSPVFTLSTGGWVLPDGPLICALAAMALCLVAAAAPGPLPPLRSAANWPAWLGAGAAAGFALLSKYTAILPLLGVLAAFTSAPALRPWLRRPQPYVAALLALLVFTPELLWNAQHGWASFAFQGGRAAAARLRPFGPFATMAGQAAYLLPWIWFGLTLVFLRDLVKGPGARAPLGWLLAWMAAIPTLLFPLVSLWSHNVLFHWAASGYLFLFPALGAWMAQWRAVTLRRWGVGTAALLGIGLVVAVTEVRFNWLARVVPGLDPGLQARNWTPLRQALAERGLLHDLIAAPNWHDTGKIAYALGPDVRVLCLNTDAREFAFNGGVPQPGQDMLIVAPGQIPPGIAAAFTSTEALPPIALPLSGRGPAAFSLAMGRGFKMALP